MHQNAPFRRRKSPDPQPKVPNPVDTNPPTEWSSYGPVYRMASSTRKRSLTGKQVLEAIDALSDSDDFEENDSDRDSNYNPSDDEPGKHSSQKPRVK